MNRSSTIFVERVDGRYLAADNARFWCMFAVVALHCTRIFTLGAEENSNVAHLIATPFKFATIGFFLVSGFLLDKNLATCEPRRLVLRRLRKVFLPWLCWSSLFVVSIALSDCVQQRTPFLPGLSLVATISTEIARCLTGTALWFVPNLLFALALLLAFRRQLDRLLLGAAFFALNLFYTFNIYTQWLPAQHTRALFAFVFYLWLGHYAATHVDGLNRMLAAISSPVLVGMTVLAAALAFGETRLLYRLGSIDPLNTLRISNQLFSVLAVLCLAKLRRRAWPRFVDVPRHIFGIYLSHALIVGVVLTTMRRLLELPELAGYAHSLGLRAALWLAATGIAWTSGFLLSRRIAASPRLCWLQGLARPRFIRPPAHEPLPEGVALFIG